MTTPYSLPPVEVEQEAPDMLGYRLLATGERLLPGDQYFSQEYQTWRDCTIFIFAEYPRHRRPPYRRLT